MQFNKKMNKTLLKKLIAWNISLGASIAGFIWTAFGLINGGPGMLLFFLVFIAIGLGAVSAIYSELSS